MNLSRFPVVFSMHVPILHANNDNIVYNMYGYLSCGLCSQAEANITKYGKQLMGEMPDETTMLLNKLCSDWIPKGSVEMCTVLLVGGVLRLLAVDGCGF